MINEKDIKDYQEGESVQPKANDRQVGGEHYKQFQGFEPWDVVTAWGLGYLDGTAVKYLSRWKHKGGIEDLKKAAHFIQKLIETETSRQEEALQKLVRVSEDLNLYDNGGYDDL